MERKVMNSPVGEKNRNGSLLHPYTNPVRQQQTGTTLTAKGDGVHVFDGDGKRHLDGMSGLWCASLGYSEPRLVEAARRQMELLPYHQTFDARATAPALELAERLVGLTSEFGFDKVLFANSGSEANDQAAKLIWFYFNSIGKPRKKKLIARTRAYHGVTVMSASLTGLALNHNDFDLPIDRVLHTDCPSYYHYGKPGESESDFVSRIIGNLEALIEREGADTIAAFFAEPIQGAGGVLMPAQGYFERLQEVLTRHGILLVADEVITGFGRTGQMFGSQTLGIKPDIMNIAKAMSSAYLPISATLLSKEISDAIVEGSNRQGMFGHGVTYSGHPVCAAVAIEVLNIMQEHDLVGHVREMSPLFLSRLKRMEEHPLVAQSRGVGLLGALEILKDKSRRVSFALTDGIGLVLKQAALDEGLIIRPLLDCVAICPPLVVTPPQIDELFDKLGRALDVTLRTAQARGLMA